MPGPHNTRYVEAVNRASRRSRALFDPGWLFLLAGVALLGAVAMIPAQEELAYARWVRDRALTIEKHRQARLDRYEEFLSALDERDRTLILTLAAGQLNLIRSDRAPIPGTVRTAVDASVFPALEPPPLKIAPFSRTRSTLARWATDDHTRVWVIGAGCFLVLVGLLPASRGWSGLGSSVPPNPARPPASPNTNTDPDPDTHFDDRRPPSAHRAHAPG